MVLNIVLFIVVAVGIFFIFRAVMDIRRQVNEKMRYVERVVQHPEDVIADIGASLIRTGVQSIKKIFRRKNTNSS